MKANPSLIAVGLLVLAIIVYSGVINPMSLSLLKAKVDLKQEEFRLDATQLAITQETDVKTSIERLEKENAKCRAAWISPMLNSYAMRVKSLLGAIAQESGLANIEYEEGTFRALPVPKEQLPQHRTARRSVRVRALADYAATVSFLLRAEKEIPLLAFQSISIQPSKNKVADLQEVEFVLEWPCEGEVIK